MERWRIVLQVASGVCNLPFTDPGFGVVSELL